MTSHSKGVRTSVAIRDVGRWGVSIVMRSRKASLLPINRHTLAWAPTGMGKGALIPPPCTSWKIERTVGQFALDSFWAFFRCANTSNLLPSEGFGP